MFLHDHSGIACDLCGGQHRHDFFYFSLDLRCVQVVDNVRPRELPQQPIMSLDVCPSCWEAMSRRIVECYRPVTQGVVCDLTGRHLLGNYEYYDGKVTKAVVKFQGPKANVNTEPNLVELAVSPEAYEELKRRLVETRKAASSWSSTASSHRDQSPPSSSTTRMG